MTWPPWRRVGEEAALVRYLQPEAVRSLLRGLHRGPFPDPGAGPFFDRLAQLWELLVAARPRYVHSPAGDGSAFQVIRPAHDVLGSSAAGTCLDLALVLAGGCVAAGWEPVIVLTGGEEQSHASVVVPVRAGARLDLGGPFIRSVGDIVGDLIEEKTGPGSFVALDPVTFAGHRDAAPLRFDEAVRAGARALRDSAGDWQVGIDVAALDSPRHRYEPVQPPPVPLLTPPYLREALDLDSLKVTQARQRVVPFVDDGVIDILRHWASGRQQAGASPIAVVSGVGGAGKTRLAAELAWELGEHGWTTGFLRDDVRVNPLREPDLRWATEHPGPLLVVADYAEGVAGTVTTLLGALGQRTERWRLLLTTRGTGEMNRTLTDAVAAAGEALAPLSIRLRPGVQAMDGLFDHAVREFARLAGTEAPGDAAYDRTVGWTTLDLVLLARQAVLRPGETLPSTKRALYRQVVEHELRYWQRVIEERRGPALAAGALVRTARAVALARPARGASPRVVQVATGLGEYEAEHAAEAIEGCLAEGEDGRLSLRPDPVADHLVRDAFGDEERGAGGLLERVLSTCEAADDRVALARSVDRASSEHRDFGLAAAVLRLDPSWWEVGLAAAAELGGSWLDATEALLVGDEPVPPEAVSAAARAPLGHAHLRRVALAAARRAVRQAEASGEGAERRVELAEELSIRLAEMGMASDAVPLQLEVVVARQAAAGSATADVDDDAKLAASLNNLAASLSGMGRRDEALAAAQEAVDLYRRLAEAAPQAFLPDLATSLNNLAAFLSGMGRRDKALTAAQEAVDLYRRLAEAAPQAFLPNLAMSLNNLAASLSGMGRRDEALTAAQEAVDLYRRLAEAAPQAFLPNLAMSLNNLGAFLSGMGRRDEALAAPQEAVDLYRRLAEAAPQAFLPDLAMSLNNLAASLSGMGRRDEALAAAQEAVDLRRRLAVAAPQAFLPNLATSLNNLANQLSDVGRRDEALTAAQEAVDLYRRLAEAA
ncbi:MAG: tetratricopeptide repeat protein, partial [Actinomycetota bacterium]|nr:tetratricopeptide repeat protein [Actinomycetota bacterium]